MNAVSREGKERKVCEANQINYEPHRAIAMVGEVTLGGDGSSLTNPNRKEPEERASEEERRR